MNECIITGASGLIGSYLIAQLSQKWSITAISRSQNHYQSKFNPVNFLLIDFAKPWDTDSLPPRADAIIHLAQSEHFREFPDYVEDVFSVNTVTTLKLLNYARYAGVKTFILASSGGIYGYGEQGFSEDLPICNQRDLGFYLGTKLCSEILAENYASFMNIIMLRFFFVYGIGQKSSMLIPRLVKSVLEEKPIILQGEHGLKCNPTYTSDAVTAIVKALELNESHKINIGGPQVISLREIGEIIGKLVDKKPKFEIQIDKNSRHLIGDIQKMSRLLGRPKVNFEEGIKIYISNSF